MGELIELIKTMVKALISGIIIAATIIGLVILALSIKQCVTIKQSQNVQTTKIH